MKLAAGIVLSPLCLRETDFSAPTLLTVLALGAIQVGLPTSFSPPASGFRRRRSA